MERRSPFERTETPIPSSANAVAAITDASMGDGCASLGETGFAPFVRFRRWATLHSTQKVDSHYTKIGFVGPAPAASIGLRHEQRAPEGRDGSARRRVL